MNIPKPGTVNTAHVVYATDYLHRAAVRLDEFFTIAESIDSLLPTDAEKAKQSLLMAVCSTLTAEEQSKLLAKEDAEVAGYSEVAMNYVRLLYLFIREARARTPNLGGAMADLLYVRAVGKQPAPQLRYHQSYFGTAQNTQEDYDREHANKK